MNHLPFRSWCEHCVHGRLANPAHKQLAPEERGVHTFSMDYAFLSRDNHGRSLTVLVCKDRETKIVMANVVMKKGADGKR